MRYAVKCGKLSNGLRFYTQHDSHTTKEIAVIVVNTGLLHDPPHRRGLSHLIEHVTCAESKTYTKEEADLVYARTMGDPDDNRYITTDWTATTYGPGSDIKKIHNRKLFRMFSEMIRESVITKKTLESERAAIHQEHYLTGRDIAAEYLSEILYGVTFPKRHIARTPIDGSMYEVRSATMQDIHKHMQKYYVPANTFVVYLGPTYEEVRYLVKEEFGEWGKDLSARKNKGPSFSVWRRKSGFSPLKVPKRRSFIFPGIRQFHIAIGFPTETYSTGDGEALDVLARILSHRMYGELRVKNRDWNKGTYRTPVFAERTYAHGIFAFHFATLDKNYVRYGIRSFKAQCKDLCNNLVSREELEAHSGYMNDYEFIDYFQQQPGELVATVADAVSNGDVDLKGMHGYGERLLRLLKRGGRQKLRQVAQKYLSRPSATVIMRPE